LKTTVKRVTRLPELDFQAFRSTREAVHGYARILGSVLKSCRPRRKHWWHASLRPSLTGLTTGVVNAGTDFELELNLRDSQLNGWTADGAKITEALQGQPASKLATQICEFLIASGIDEDTISNVVEHNDVEFDAYSNEHAGNMGLVLNFVAAALAKFRAGIREETSPIQLWPHHFDLSMLWLPGEKIPGQDPTNEEYSDKQMNFGFTFGDDNIPEAYFYVTAYPLADEFAGLQLPAGSRWQSDGFSGVVLPYGSLLDSRDPDAYLLELWNGLLSAGRDTMLGRSD
jgi:hypothetical protein